MNIILLISSSSLEEKISAHYFWKDNDFYLYQNNLMDMILGLKFDSLELLNRLELKEYTIKNGDSLDALAMQWYGSHQGTQILGIINPTLKTLQIGAKIKFWRSDELFFADSFD